MCLKMSKALAPFNNILSNELLYLYVLVGVLQELPLKKRLLYCTLSCTNPLAVIRRPWLY